MFELGPDVPEKIVLCLDLCQEEDPPLFEVSNGKKYSQSYMIKRASQFFCRLKLTLDKKHKIAIVGLTKTAILLQTLTSEITELNKAIDELPEPENYESFEMESLLEMVNEMTLESPHHIDSDQVPSIIRVVFIYGRSNIIPTVNEESIGYLNNVPAFFMDMLYIHKEPEDENNVMAIYEILKAFNTKRRSYLLQTNLNATKLHNEMGKLTAHPLQRCPQASATWSLSVGKENIK